MKYGKKILASAITLGLAAGSLSGCYSKVKLEDYGKTVVASFGSKEIMLDEVNYYIKMYQQSYDSSFYYYSYFYGYSSTKELFAAVADEDTGKTVWDGVKESAMAAVYQTYVLCDKATEYNVSLSDEDKSKVDEAVKDYFEEGDSGLIDAINVSEDHLKEILTRNALANKVYDYIVKDIDTSVEEADFRHTVVSYFKVEQKEEETETTTSSDTTDTAETTEKAEAETTEAEKKDVDLKAAADELKTKWSSAITEEKDYASVASDLKTEYEDNKDVTITLTSDKNYAKPTDSTDSSSSTVDTELQKYCWNDLKTGEFGIYEDEDSAVYVIYCSNDNDEESKEEAIESELDGRRNTMFEEKWPNIVKSCPEWKVKSKVYAQVVWAEIKYDEETTAETTTAEATTAETTTESSTSAEETTAADTTTVAEETATTAAETTTEAETTAQ